MVNKDGIGQFCIRCNFFELQSNTITKKKISKQKRFTQTDESSLSWTCLVFAVFVKYHNVFMHTHNPKVE